MAHVPVLEHGVRTLQGLADAWQHTMLRLRRAEPAGERVGRRVEESEGAGAFVRIDSRVRHPIPDPVVRHVVGFVLGYTTFISYNTSIPRIATLTAARLTDNEGLDGWTGGAVTNLPKYHAAVRTRNMEQIQPAFIVSVKDFDDGYRPGDK